MTHQQYPYPVQQPPYPGPEPGYGAPLPPPDATAAASAGTGITDISIFGPILVFAAVFVILFAILMKTKILGEDSNPWVNVLVAFVVASIVTLSVGLREVVLLALPWFGVILMALFAILVLVGFMGKSDAIIGKGFGWTIVVVVALAFIFAIGAVFFGDIVPYLPGAQFGLGGDPELTGFFSWLYSSSVITSIVFIVVAVIVGWILVKKS